MFCIILYDVFVPIFQVPFIFKYIIDSFNEVGLSADTTGAMIFTTSVYLVAACKLKSLIRILSELQYIADILC